MGGLVSSVACGPRWKAWQAQWAAGGVCTVERATGRTTCTCATGSWSPTRRLLGGDLPSKGDGHAPPGHLTRQMRAERINGAVGVLAGGRRTHLAVPLLHLRAATEGGGPPAQDRQSLPLPGSSETVWSDQAPTLGRSDGGACRRSRLNGPPSSGYLGRFSETSRPRGCPAGDRRPGDRRRRGRAAAGGGAVPAGDGRGRPAAQLVAAGTLHRPFPSGAGSAVAAAGCPAVQLRRRGGPVVPDAAAGRPGGADVGLGHLPGGRGADAR